MKSKFFGIFSKVFFYTVMILVFVVAVLFAFFSDQIKSAVTVTQQRQIAEAFQPLLASLRGKTDAEIVAIAREFHAKNASFDFGFESSEGRILYQTRNFKIPKSNMVISLPRNVLIQRNHPGIIVPRQSNNNLTSHF